MRFPSIALFVVLASCASFSRLGGIVEGTAYPAGGAAIGASVGPLGAAAGAGVGHLVGELAMQEETVVIDGKEFQRIYVRQTALEWVMENWLWLLGIGYILHRCPWLPKWIWDKLKQRKEKKAEEADPEVPPAPPLYQGPGDI